MTGREATGSLPDGHARSGSPQGREEESTRLCRFAAGLSILASFVHGLNVQEHLVEWWGYGVFFLFAASAQLLYGLVLLVGPWRYDETGGLRDGDGYGRPFYLAGVLMNLGLIALYAWTRTVGIPVLGPGAGEVEPVSVPGILTKVAEALLVICLVRLLRRPGTAAGTLR